MSSTFSTDTLGVITASQLYSRGGFAGELGVSTSNRLQMKFISDIASCSCTWVLSTDNKNCLKSNYSTNYLKFKDYQCLITSELNLNLVTLWWSWYQLEPNFIAWMPETSRGECYVLCRVKYDVIRERWLCSEFVATDARARAKRGEGEVLVVGECEVACREKGWWMWQRKVWGEVFALV